MNLQENHSLIVATLALLIVTAACGRPETGSEQTHPGDSKGAAPADGYVHPEEPAAGVVELSAEAAARIDLRTAPVQLRVLGTQLSTTGQVDFDQTRLAHVSPRISGRVHRVNVVLRQHVDAGQRLAEVDSIELGQAKAAFLQTKAKEELARRTFARAESLFVDRIASEQSMLEAEAKLREATAGLRTTEETLHLYGLSQQQVDALTYDDREASIYPLRAPFAGTIVERHATIGELVTPERNLFTLADLSRVWIWIDIYQRDLGGVHVDDHARARVDAFPNEVFAGKVSYLSAQVDTDTRTVRARLEVSNPAGKLRPGMFVEVDLIDPHAGNGSGLRAASLALPESAVVRAGNQFFVFVAIAEHRFEKRQIRTGRHAGGFVEILPGATETGVQKGDSVVVEGAFLLKSAAAKESLVGGHDH